MNILIFKQSSLYLNGRFFFLILLQALYYFVILRHDCFVLKQQVSFQVNSFVLYSEMLSFCLCQYSLFFPFRLQMLIERPVPAPFNQLKVNHVHIFPTGSWETRNDECSPDSGWSSCSPYSTMQCKPLECGNYCLQSNNLIFKT